MKIVTITDLHLGVKQYKSQEREQDFYDLYQKCIDAIVDEKPDLVINGGDIFDVATPSPKAINEFKKGLMKLRENDIPMISIVGNHTLIQRLGFFPIDYLYEDDYLYTVLDERNEFQYVKDDVFVGGVPYHTAAQQDNLISIINKLGDQAKGYKTRILVLHQALEEDFPMGFEVESGKINYDLFDIIIVGHIHSRMERIDKSGCKIIYPGSLGRCSIKEALDEKEQGKGYTIINSEDNSFKNVDIEMPRQFLKIYLEQNDSLENELKKIKDSLDDKDEPPVLFLNISGDNNAFITDLIQQNELKENSLFLNYNFTSTEKNLFKDVEGIKQDENGDFVKLSVEELILDMSETEEEGKLALEIFRALNGDDSKDDSLQKVEDIAEAFFKKNYHKSQKNTSTSIGGG